MKILIYIVYFVIFTFCYFILNKKLSNRWILICYPLLFVVSILPIKLLTDLLIKEIGRQPAKYIIVIILMALASFTLFNLFYAIVNLMVGLQKTFHQEFNQSNLGKNPIKYFIENTSNLKNMLHFLFYLAGVILYGLFIYKFKI